MELASEVFGWAESGGCELLGAIGVSTTNQKPSLPFSRADNPAGAADQDRRAGFCRISNE
jgi:hypothetical protein